MSEEVIFSVADTPGFVEWLNIKLIIIYPRLFDSQYNPIMLPENDPRIDKDDPYEQERGPHYAEFINKDFYIEVEPGNGNVSVVTIRLKNPDKLSEYLEIKAGLGKWVMEWARRSSY